MLRSEIINSLINKFSYTSYLEIGVCSEEHNFNLIKCDEKYGIDPNGCSTYAMTSDEFFKINIRSYDIVFIDGLHTEEQVDRDIQNSLKYLNKGGSIVLHDCLPFSREHQREIYGGYGMWAGTVWKSIAKLRTSREDLSIEVVDTDYGCGIIQRGNQKLYSTSEDYLDYSFYASNRIELMNIISVRKFRSKYV